MCGVLPFPPEAMLIFPGLDLTYVMNSGTVSAGIEGCTTITPRYSHDGCYRGNIPNEIEIEITVQRCIDRVGSRGLQKRISIWRGFGHRFCSEVTSSANSVLNNEL